MIAIITQLWDTERRVITFKGGDTEYPSRIDELDHCENVSLVTRDVYQRRGYDVTIDDEPYIVKEATIRNYRSKITHQLLEVFYSQI